MIYDPIAKPLVLIELYDFDVSPKILVIKTFLILFNEAQKLCLLVEQD